MKKIESIVLFAIAIVTASFIYKNGSSNNDNGFTIIGFVHGYPDGTMLYLENESGHPRKLIDSAAILNGQFKLSGSVNSNVVYALIHTKNFSDYKFFWLENNPVTFNAEKGKFRYAIIRGSKTQNDADILNASINPLEKKTDSLNSLNKNLLSEQGKTEIYKQIDLLRIKELSINMDFIKNNPGSIVSASLLDTYSSSFGKEKSMMLYNNFSKENKETQYGKDILQYITLNKDLKVGDHYANFSQKTPLGADIKISDYAGKTILIDFWASWCVPCRNENPELVKTYAMYKDKGFEIIGVSLDGDPEKKDWIDAIEKDGLTWPNISELKGDKNTAALMYGISGIPDSFLIDKNGIILARDLRGQALRDKLQELLK